MINILMNLELTNEDIYLIKEFINDENKEDLLKNIALLEKAGCDTLSIRNIIIGNPFFLNRSYMDIYKLLNCLSLYKFTYLNLLFDSNPSFLNKDDFEIREYIEKKESEGKSLEEIVDEIEDNPFIIDESM
jgi:hypothetical protein